MKIENTISVAGWTLSAATPKRCFREPAQIFSDKLSAAARDKKRIGEFLFHFSVDEWPAIDGGDAASCCGEHGMAGGDIPFHCTPESRIDIGLAGSNKAELQ